VRGRLFPVTDDWYEWRGETPLAATVLVRVAIGDGGRLVLAGLRIDGSPSAELLRAIPVGRIEAVANAQLSVVDDVIMVNSAANALVNSRARPLVPPAAGADGWETTDPTRAVPRNHGPDIARLRGRPDVFYRDVADVYLELAQASHRPASEIAAQHGVPVSTAHRWVKEARRRGFLPPGRPGKTG
jgi:hypothetical protein